MSGEASIPAGDGVIGAGDSIRAGDGSIRATTATDHVRQTAPQPVLRVGRDVTESLTDTLAGEEPLLVRVAGPDHEPIEVATVMRTPGFEADLAVGLLYAEGLLEPGEVTDISFADPHLAARPDDEVTVHLSRPVPDGAVSGRQLTATAACGVCGRASIDDLLARCQPVADGPTIPWELVHGLPDVLRDRQGVFDLTGGLHAAGIATADGELVTVREDIGRHNALDAAIGHHVRRGEVPLAGHLGVLSGRIGFELVQKAAVAGLPVLIAVGAPSDLAARTAGALNMTLVGFVRGGGGNVYTHPERIEV